MNFQINWESFSTYNQDARGIRFKFEDLCRQLFINENGGNKYPHSNPNNIGIEIEPIYDEQNRRWIGFQSKYFDNDVDYRQIKKSANKIVSSYGGRINHIYLFCNKSLNTLSKGYINAIKPLKDAGISVEPITNDAILDIVRKYPYLGSYYFGDHTLSSKWFFNHNSNMLDQLDERFNRKFNVKTMANDELSLFVNDEDAVEYINGKKALLLQTIEKLYGRRDKDCEYLYSIKKATQEIPDVSRQTLSYSFSWRATISFTIIAPTLFSSTSEIKSFQAGRLKLVPEYPSSTKY